jgi:hypothetical protein
MRGAEIANASNPIAPDRNVDMFPFSACSVVNRASFDNDVEVSAIFRRRCLFCRHQRRKHRNSCNRQNDSSSCVAEQDEMNGPSS